MAQWEIFVAESSKASHHLVSSWHKGPKMLIKFHTRNNKDDYKVMLKNDYKVMFIFRLSNISNGIGVQKQLYIWK